ncbi:ACS family D-galactonate transporter-like MFS transporter [Caballeronia udeis]|uniref:ACS family D-galactonate transporter-like MFS transporter n=1 Tax=Caballeronia udeis TaxID=1232866 RepID=A0ABW8MV00_9BURK
MKNRWLALIIIFFSFLQFTLNWFNIVPAFGGLVADMHLALPQLGIVVGMFIAGYGVAHIPGGVLAEVFGLRFDILFGVAVETLGTLISAHASSLDILLIGRFVCGVGGSIYLGSAIGLTAAWFRDHELATANGLITGVAFTAGAALGLYLWEGIVATSGWRDALMLGAIVGAGTFAALIFVFPTPPESRKESLGGSHLGMAVFRRTFYNRDLWLLGASLLAGYGSYFTAVELLPTYAISHLHASAHAANKLSTILLLSGFIGGAIGGWCADRLFGLVPTIIGACCIEAVATVFVPLLDIAGLQIAAAVIGAFGTLSFVVWIAVPGAHRDRIPLADVPIASGLMLTIAAVGGVVMPALYGKVALSYSPASAWTVLGVMTFSFSFVGLLVRQPIASAGMELKRA